MLPSRVSASTAAVACLVTLIVAGKASAQHAGAGAAADTAAIELTAARYVHDALLPAGQVHFDPRVLTVAGRSRTRTAQHEVHLARALGARVASIDSLVVCAGATRVCHLQTDNVVEFRRPYLRGDSAALRVSLLSPTQSPERPILGRGITLLLQRDSSGIWRVVGRGKRARTS